MAKVHMVIWPGELKNIIYVISQINRCTQKILPIKSTAIYMYRKIFKKKNWSKKNMYLVKIMSLLSVPAK